MFLRCTDVKKLKASIPKQHSINAWSFFPVNIQNPEAPVPYLPFKPGNYHHSTSNFARFSLFLPGFLLKYNLVRKRRFQESAPCDADILLLIQT